MDGLLTAWNNRTAQQWIEEAGRFEKMAENSIVMPN